MKFCQSWKLVQIVKVGASLTVFGEKLSELFPSFPSAPFLSCPFLPVVLARSMKYSRRADADAPYQIGPIYRLFGLVMLKAPRNTFATLLKRG